MEKELLEEKTQTYGSEYDVADDVAGIKVVFVNVYMIGKQGEGNPWVLVDAAIPNSASRIIKEAETRFGKDNPPQAIVLTHGHFDHTGALEDLLKAWGNIPVYAHPLEMPFLTGKSHYPPPDPTAGNGAMAALSFLFPIRPLDISGQVKPIPHDGFIEELPDWRFIHTPGHAPGHVSLFRDKDKVLIAGDAFVTTNQNSVFSVATQKLELHGPPSYFTCDWRAAKKSVRRLAQLKPSAVGTGHGKALRGKEWRSQLQELSDNFDTRALPGSSRYINHPAHTDENGIVSMPTPISYWVAKGLAIGAVAGLTLFAWNRLRK
ncbi:MBL fold metallo-hydrolase [Siphonobacter sp.]|uniref:MBL fold metallo-hydrolase n=1 Tax=Siphonobacter sp. TaxID=1869184 RepID=UPI003B3AD894